LRRKLQVDKNLLDRKISGVMTVNPKTVSENMLAYEAAQLMKKYNCDNMPVVDRGNKPVGMIDERDLISVGIM
jgi:arabinose-5-phosphate isomerase